MKNQTLLMKDLSPDRDTAEKVKTRVETDLGVKVESVLLFDSKNLERFAVVTYTERPKVKGAASVALADTIDRYIPEPERAIDKPFLMPLEDRI